MEGTLRAHSLSKTSSVFPAGGGSQRCNAENFNKIKVEKYHCHWWADKKEKAISVCVDE